MTILLTAFVCWLIRFVYLRCSTADLVCKALGML